MCLAELENQLVVSYLILFLSMQVLQSVNQNEKQLHLSSNMIKKGQSQH